MTLAGELATAGPAVALPLADGSPVALAQECRDSETDQITSYELSKGESLDCQIKASLTGKPGDARSGTDLTGVSLFEWREEFYA